MGGREGGLVRGDGGGRGGGRGGAPLVEEAGDGLDGEEGEGVEEEGEGEQDPDAGGEKEACVFREVGQHKEDDEE